MSDLRSLVGGVKFDAEPPPPPMSGAFSAAAPMDPVKFCTIGRRQVQAGAGSCGPHAATAMIEAWAKKTMGANLEIARLDVYDVAREEEGNGAEGRDGGVFPSMLRRAFERRGFISEARVPYDWRKATTYRRPAEWEADAQLNRCKFAVAPNDINAILPLVNDDTVVGLAHACYDSIFNLRPDGIEQGRVGQLVGGHWRVVCGYDIPKGMLLLWNWWESWGIRHPEFDETGFSWVPFEVIQDGKWTQDTSFLATPPAGIQS